MLSLFSFGLRLSPLESVCFFLLLILGGDLMPPVVC